MARRSLSLLKNLARYSTPFSLTPKPIISHSTTRFSLTPEPISHSVSYMPRVADVGPRAVTLIPGDGIGPLITNAVEQVMDALQAPVYFEKYDVHGDMKQFPQEVINSIKKNRVCLKGGLRIIDGLRSLDEQLRKELNLFASLMNCFNLPGLPAQHENVDIAVIKENTRIKCSELNHYEEVSDHVENLKVIIKFCSERIAKYAFEYAYLNNRKKVTALHRANVIADGWFLESCRNIATKYLDIKYDEITVDYYHGQLASKPQQFDVMVTPNDPCGNGIAYTAAKAAGTIGLMPRGIGGPGYAVFEEGVPVGNVGNEKTLEQKKANPVALLLSSAMMLRHLELPLFADRLETAVKQLFSEGKYGTRELDGDSTTQEVVDAVIANLDCFFRRNITAWGPGTTLFS